VAYLASIGIDGEVTKPEAYEDIPVGDKAEEASSECHAVVSNLNRICINIAQAASKMGGQQG